jgi:hypothetical protein
MGKNPMWAPQQQTLGKIALYGSSIPTTIGLYPRKPYPGAANPLWSQLNPTSIPPQGNFPNQSMNSMIPIKQPPQT